MAGEHSEGGGRPKIVVNARGEEREVPPPEEPKEEAPKEKEEKKSGFNDFAKGAAAGLIADEAAEVLGRAALKAGRKFMKEKVWHKGQEGGEGQPPPGKPPDGEKGEANEPDGRSFNKIQDQLKALINNPNPDEEIKLRMERARLISEAKEVGVFDSIKHHIEDIQRKTPDFVRAGEEVAKINIDNMEVEARGLDGWSDKFEGMLDEYRDVAVLSMEHALLEAEGKADPKHMADLEREIEIRSWGTIPPGLETMARGYLEGQKPKSSQESDGLEAKIGRLLDRIDKQEESREALLNGYSGLTSSMVEQFRGSPPDIERERWSDAEHKQQFYARFTPNIEPRFYQLLSPTERERFDARWQLARAAFVKRATAGAPDKYRENQELELFGREQMEVLYKIPGVKLMLEGYAQAITKSRTFNVDGRQISFWQIKDADTFLKFREAMRKEILGDDGMFRNTGEVRSAAEPKKGWWTELLRKEADAIAWNWIWVGNLAESADSRYSFSGLSVPGIPGSMSAGEYKYVLHPQERFESKSSSGHFWGIFGKWGVTQVKRMKDESHFRGDRDEIRFLAAARGNYWEWNKTDEPSTDPKKAAVGGRIFNFYAPECYATAPCGSFWEETSISKFDSNGKEKRTSLLDYLKEGDPIPWEDVQQDAWSIYMYGKFHKASQLLEYFNPEKPPQKIDRRQDGWGWIWADPLLELFTRLSLENRVKDLTKTGKTHQTFHNLKVWLVYAGFGGVRNIDTKGPSVPLSSRDKNIVTEVLQNKNIEYLKGRRFLGLLPGEGLNIE